MKNVLVVDDHEINRMLAGRLLMQINCNPTFCENGLVAIQMVKDFEFDLILMDCNMPIMDGLTSTQSIRALKGTKATIPIIAYSADHDNNELALLAGANAFLPKPVRFVDFRDTILKYI